MFVAFLLCLAASRSRSHTRENSQIMDVARQFEQLEADENREFVEMASELRDDLESNRAISEKKVQKFIDFLEKRTQKKRIKKLFEKLLKKRGLDRVTGKKLVALQKGCRLAKTKCLRAQKLARRRVKK